MFTNYRYVMVGRKIIALSTYAGKTVRGVAICSEHDQFDVEKGKALAAARCNEKVAAKRYERASRKLNDALDEFNNVEDKLTHAEQYYHDAYLAYNEAAQHVDVLLKELS